MRVTSNPYLRGVCLTAVLVVSAGFGAIGMPVSAAEPAKLEILSGKTAADLRKMYDPVKPVLVAGAGVNVVAIVFDENLAIAEKYVSDLFNDKPAALCSGDGPAACCDPDTQMMVLNATYDNKAGLVQMGQLCDAPRAAKGVAFTSVANSISRVLYEDFGVDYCLMELSDANGTPRVLVNAPWDKESPFQQCPAHTNAVVDDSIRTLAWTPSQGGALSPKYSLIRHESLRENVQVVPVAHSNPPPPPHCQSAAPDQRCRENGYRFCSSEVGHWYLKVFFFNTWCQMRTTCSCP